MLEILTIGPVGVKSWIGSGTGTDGSSRVEPWNRFLISYLQLRFQSSTFSRKRTYSNTVRVCDVLKILSRIIIIYLLELK